MKLTLEQIERDRREQWGREDVHYGTKVVGEIEYIDTAPQPINVQIPLVEYFERVKRVKAYEWQKDFCARLQDAAVERPEHQTLEIIHAEAQLGKSVILAQVYPAWLLGHDPIHRTVLATYNITRSEDHSSALIRTMQGDVHKSIFPNKAGHLPDTRVSKEKWMTNARIEVNDGQFSFKAVGLESGITGSGFDTWIIDDPYATAKDAFSSTIRKNLQKFYSSDVLSRFGLNSNLFAMFHRYSVDDLAGFLLDTGDFNYLRYATQADGVYTHDETGQKFADPLGREIGEYICPEKRPPRYYEKVRKNNRVWLSMNQGRPSAEQGEFFNVGKIDVVSAAEAAERKARCAVLVRSWDLAATEQGGDYSVGTLAGMESSGRVTVFEIERKQVESAGRDELMLNTAKKDGKDVVVTIPEDPAAGGKTTVFHVRQLLKGYNVVTRSTRGSKEDRARSYASAVNSGEVSFADDSHLPEEKQWIKEAKREMRDFPLSEHKDITDSGSDAYNECFERKAKGLVITNYRPARNLIGWKMFQRLFPNIRPSQAIPDHWRIYVGVKITDEASRPNSALIVAQSSINANLNESLLVLAEYKKYDNNFHHLFDWLANKLTNNFSRTPKENIKVFLHRDSDNYLTTIKQKLNFNVSLFRGDASAGLTETNWYLMPKDFYNPFFPEERATGLYLITDDNQLSVAVNESGFADLRQEFSTWGFNDKGDPSQIGQVAECLRMICYGFKTYAIPLTDNEMVEREIAKRTPALTLANIARDGKGVSAGAHIARLEEESRHRKELGIEKENISDFIYGEEGGKLVVTENVDKLILTARAKGNLAELRVLVENCEEKETARPIFRELYQILVNMERKHNFRKKDNQKKIIDKPQK